MSDAKRTKLEPRLEVCRLKAQTPLHHLQNVCSAALSRHAAFVLAFPAAALLTLVNCKILYAFAPLQLWPVSDLRSTTVSGVIAGTVMAIYFVFTGWLTLYTLLFSALESRKAHRCAASLKAQTQNAELRALRYQLNPHFLFNALNTVSALVMSGEKNGAEDTIHALSVFLRTTLESEPLDDITLAAEIDMQHLYLDIEKLRYGDRLDIRLSVPDDLQSALLPSLLLQPLVENVIRHAVAPSQEPVTMTIQAFAAFNSLHLLVEDDGSGGTVQAGTGTGLRNAASRLATRFGTAGQCHHGQRPGGGYRVELVLPLRLQATSA